MKTYSGKAVQPGKIKNQLVNLIKYVPGGMLCWPWQQTIDRLVSNLGKIRSSAHPSYEKIQARIHLIRLGGEAISVLFGSRVS